MRKTFEAVLVVFLLAPALAVAQPASKIGVVDQDRVLNESEEGKRLQGELVKLREAKAADIETKENEIKALREQLLSAQLSLSEEKREEISRQLKRKRVEYERLNDDATLEFQDAANRAQAKLVNLFRDVINQYGSENGYTAIFEKNTLYFAARPIDITDELLARFNQVVSAGGTGAPKG